MLARYKEHFCILKLCLLEPVNFGPVDIFYQVTVILNCAVMPRVNKKGVKTAVKDSINGFNANSHGLKDKKLEFLF